MIELTSPEVIATFLNEQQKVALLWLNADRSYTIEDGSWGISGLNHNLWSLRRFPIATDVFVCLVEVYNCHETDWRLTQLGQRVRKVIADQVNSGA